MRGALSAVLLGLWRLYTRHIDDHLANLYPDLLLCEGVLRLPYDRGTSGYLAKAVPHVKELLTSSELSVQDRVKGIEALVKEKHAGDRGHMWMDVLSLLIVIIITVFSVLAACDSGNPFYWYYLSGNVFGIIFIVLAMTKFQGNPKACDVERILQELHQPG